jgi:small subunit ribosomal protein S6
MALYEHVFLARQDISPQQVEALTDSYKSVIADNGGSIGKTEYWGLKSLTYKIKKSRKAHFTLMNIDAPAAAVAEMERQMSLSDDIIRHLTLKVEAHEDGPSVMMRSRGGRERDRDDRRGRRDDRRDDSRPPEPRPSAGPDGPAGAVAVAVADADDGSATTGKDENQE